MTDLDTRPPSRPRFRRKPLWIAAAVIAVIAVTVGLALFQPWRIFTRNTVDEALPVAAAGQTPAIASDAMTTVPVAIEPELNGTPATTPAVTEPVEAPGRDSATQVAASAPAPAEQPARVEPAPAEQPAPADAPPVAEQPATVELPAAVEQPATAQGPNTSVTEPIVLAAGTFVDGEHSTSGTARILQLPDGSRFVRLEGFSTSDGPDVHVWLSDQQAGGDDWGKYDDSRYVPLGSLKGTDGNQNYAVPSDAELSGLSSVVIWCDRFNVAFGSAAVAL